MGAPSLRFLEGWGFPSSPNRNQKAPPFQRQEGWGTQQTGRFLHDPRAAWRYTVSFMQFDIVTIFPEFFTGPLDYGIVRRAREAGLVDVRVHDLRAFTHDRHRTVDDRPFGGGEGMVLKPEPLFAAVESLASANAAASPGTAVVLLSASGKLFRQETARCFAQLGRIILLCGRYEGVDERVAEHLATDELSIGDFVLSGGELGAALIMDAVTRLIPGRPWQRRLRPQRILQRCSSRGRGHAVFHQSPVTLRERSGQASHQSPPARLPALHSPRRIPRLERPGSSDRRQPRRNSQVASAKGAGENTPQPPGLARHPTP